LRLYRLGSTYHEHLAWWPTSGAASDIASLQIPADAPPGWYELRLMSLDSSRALAVVARSDAFEVGTPW
jgi:hypothetical protein